MPLDHPQGDAAYRGRPKLGLVHYLLALPTGIQTGAYCLCGCSYLQTEHCAHQATWSSRLLTAPKVKASQATRIKPIQQLPLN